MSMPNLGPQDFDPPAAPPSTWEMESATVDQPDPPVVSGGDDPRGGIGIGEVEGAGRVLEPQADLANEPEPQAPRSGWRLVALIAHDGKEPPAGLADDLALATWCAASALWHPSLLARAAELPKIEPVETPSAPAPREIRVIAAGTLDRLPSGYRTQAEDAGAILLESGTDRAALIGQIQERLGAVGTPETSDDPAMIAVADDFLALGATHWLLRDVATAMGHEGAINHEALTREILTGADAWQGCDRSTAVNRLRAGFEVLTQARERFYPVDAYLVDLCLLDPSMPEGVLAGPLETHVAISLLAPAQAIENQASRDPQGMERLVQAISEGWVDVAGGPYAEAENLVLPLESTLWHFRRGSEVYRAHLDDRNVETFARRRFGLFTQLPQIAKRFGFRYALHLGFDGGRFPIRSEVKRLWESPDGTSLETLLRPPLAADRPSQGLMVAWRLAASMRNDHVATLPLVHWPAPVALWYRDLRRGATYSPVLGRWVTLNDYFHLTDRPYETFRPDPDSYVSPYLAQAAALRDPEPISRLARHHRLRARFDALEWTRATALAISAAATGTPTLPEVPGAQPDAASVENFIETGRHADAASGLDTLEPFWAGELSRGILAARPGSSGSPRPGYLVINPLGVPRRVAVVLPDAALDLRPEGPLRASQLTDEGVCAVVDLPAFGFAWVPGESKLELPAAEPGGLSARGRTLKNETIELEIDEATGGIRGVMAVGESTPRIGQQLMLSGLGEAGAKPLASQMKAERFDIDYAGPALVQATATGKLIDSRTGARLAGFAQRYRLWTGRPVLEIDITLREIDPSWLALAAGADPWTVHLASRWAWPDPSSMLRRTVLLAPEVTEIDRPETPDAIDISTRRQRTALLFCGLPYHQKHGGRMLDTLLVAGAETGRSFRMGVVLDLEHPFQAALDMLTPAPVVPTALGPPALGSRGWLIHLDHKAVAVTHVGFVEATSEGRSWGLVLHLLETSGQSSRCRIRFFRNPTWARQIDFQGELIIDLSLDGDALLIDLTPNELARVEVTLG
jgi:alpha-mannosidase